MTFSDKEIRSSSVAFLGFVFELKHTHTHTLVHPHTRSITPETMNCTSLSLFLIHDDFRNWKSATSSLRNFCICSLGSRWRRRWRWRRLPAMTNVVANLARSGDNGMNVCCASNSVDVKSGVERDQQERERERERCDEGEKERRI